MGETMATTKEVFDHHNETFANLDLEGVLEDYAEDSTIVSNMGTYSGMDEIREMFEAFFEEFDDPDATFELKEEIVEGNIGYTTWEAESPENVYEFGTDTFFIQDGKIVDQTFAAKVSSK